MQREHQLTRPASGYLNAWAYAHLRSVQNMFYLRCSDTVLFGMLQRPEGLVWA